MKRAEKVTFGGSGLDRAVELRGDDRAQARMRADPAARALAFWHGKPMIDADTRDRLVWLPLDHPALVQGGVPVFLGRGADAAPCFAVDVSAWQPAEVDMTHLGAFFDKSEQRHPQVRERHCFAEMRGFMTRIPAREAELAAMAKAVIGWHRTHGFCSRCGHPTDITMAGWQTTCPSCKAHHFPRTDPVVIMLITRGNSVLLGRSHNWPTGMYSLLAGFVEPGETIEAAVRREVREETGVKVGEVRYLASQPWPYPMSLMLGCHGQALSGRITIDPEEIDHATWLTREEMLDVFAGCRPDILPARKGAIAHFLLQHWLADRLD